MKKSLYLGNGCLYAEVSDKAIMFENSSICTSQVVCIDEYELYVNHDKLSVVKSEDVTVPHNGGGDKTSSTLTVELRANTSFVVMCNAQNQIDSYVQFEIDNELNVTFVEVAAQCYYTNEFQGLILDEKCSENEFNTYLEFIKIKDVDAICELNIQHSDFLNTDYIVALGFDNSDEMKHHYRMKAVNIESFKKTFEETSSKFYNVVDNDDDKSQAIALLDDLKELQFSAPEMVSMEEPYLTLHTEIQRAESYFEIFQSEYDIDTRSEFIRAIEDNLAEMEEMYQNGKDIRNIMYHFGITTRNDEMTMKLNELFNFIDSANYKAAKALYDTLVLSLGYDDPAMLEAKISLKYL